jgi:hypothetical protein
VFGECNCENLHFSAGVYELVNIASNSSAPQQR